MLRPARNCWRIERARRVAFLIDGDDYFAAVRAAIATARRSIFILGWDIDSRMCLVPQGAGDGYPEPLGEFLNAVVAERAELHAYILAWDYAMLYALEREWLPVFQFDWKTHRRVAFHLDSRHPLGACHHQKVIVVDDDIALLGGFDLTKCRWDTSEHACDAPLRKDTSGHAYGPFHDVGAMVSGDCARALGELARDRWRRATGHAPQAPVAAGAAVAAVGHAVAVEGHTVAVEGHAVAAEGHAVAVEGHTVAVEPVAAPAEGHAVAADGHAPAAAWPENIPVDLYDVDVAIARTQPAFAGARGVTEIRALHLDAIASARRGIFAENQYFTSRTIADAFARRLAEPDGPEIALVMPANQSGWLEASTMGVLRARLHANLRAADPRRQYRLYCPSLAWQRDGDQCLNVHSKLMVVDDDLVTLGSANLSERSQSLDTECNIAIEARGDPRVRDAIVALRARLLAEHVGARVADVEATLARERSLHRAIDALGDPHGRRLTAFDPHLDPTVDALTPDHEILDPERPLDPDVVVADLLPAPEPRSRVRRRFALLALAVLALAAVAFGWRFTPLAGVVDFNALARAAGDFTQSPMAPVVVALAYVIGGLLVVPLTLLIGVTAVMFGPIVGGFYAITGALLSASVTYAIGRRLGHGALRRFAGRRLNLLSQRLGRRGLLAMVIVRLLPIAPYSMVNVVAGASHIGWRDFLLGTAIGLAPGVFGVTLFVDRAVTAIRNPGPVTFAVLAAIVALLVAAGWMIRKQLDEPAAQQPAGAPSVSHAD